MLLSTHYHRYNLCNRESEFVNVWVVAAGTGAAENWGGAGEHPRVCEDEKQPSQDQAGDGWGGTNHLKTPPWVSGSDWECVVCGARWWPDRGPTRTSWLFQPSCSFLQWGETLQTKDTPLSACHGPPVLTSASHTHSAAHSTPPPWQEGPDTELPQDTHLRTRANKLPMSSDGETTKQTHTRTHTRLSIPSVFTLFTAESCCFSLSCYQCCCCCVFFTPSFSDSDKKKWTLDGLLKLCNVKAKQMCFCYLCW